MIKNAIIYRIAESWQPDLQALEDALQKCVFTECGATQERSVGWVAPRGEAHGLLAESVAGQWMLRFMSQSKLLPASVLNDKVNAKADHIEKTEGRKPGKKEKRELKDEAKLDLLPMAFTKSGAMWVWIDPQARTLVLDTSAQGRADEIVTLLVEALPSNLQGRVADFGAGWGYLSQQVLGRCPQVTALDVFEADARALALAQCNLADAKVPVTYHWQDVAAGVAGRFDAIVCNPPFHALGRGDRPDIGRAFIAAASTALRAGGRLWLVANRHLPYEEALGSGFAQVRTVAQQGGFKIVEAVKA